MTDIPTITQEEAVEVRAYRKKPVVIDAVHLPTRDKAGAEIGVCTGGSGCKSKAPDGAWPHVHTLEGDHTWTPGDWIITGVKGERYFCKPDIFEATYEPAALSPNMDHAVGGVLERFPDGTANVHSPIILVHQLRASADIQDRQTKRETGWADTSDRASLMREAASAIEALSASTPPVNQDAVREAADREARDEIITALAGGISAIDAAADKWVELTEVRRSTQAIASVFAKYTSDDIMQRFIDRVVAIQHLAFAEGFYAAHEAALLAQPVHQNAVQKALVKMKDAGDRILSAVDAYNAENGTHLVAPAFFEMGRALAVAAAALATPPLDNTGLDAAPWPKLTMAMIQAAAEAHYGKRNVRAISVYGLDMSAHNANYTFVHFMRRIWPALRKASALASGDRS